MKKHTKKLTLQQESIRVLHNMQRRLDQVHGGGLGDRRAPADDDVRTAMICASEF